MSVLIARRRDGTPARVGDCVVTVTAQGRRNVGEIHEIGQPFRRSRPKRLEQTYSIRIRGGYIFPVFASAIKHAAPSKWPPRAAKRVAATMTGRMAGDLAVGLVPLAGLFAALIWGAV